jgi:hypothetical protein
MSFILRSTLTTKINLNCGRKNLHPLKLWCEILNSVVLYFCIELFWQLYVLTSKSFQIYHYKEFLLRLKVLQCVKIPPPTSTWAGKNVKLIISHQCWRGWWCTETSKNFYFLRNRHPRINDVGFCRPLVIYCPQLQLLHISLSKKGFLGEGIPRFPTIAHVIRLVYT